MYLDLCFNIIFLGYGLMVLFLFFIHGPGWSKMTTGWHADYFQSVGVEERGGVLESISETTARQANT